MKKIKFLTIVALMLLYTARLLSQDTIFVATDGNDDNPGSFSYPWQTIQYACDNASPGSIVYIRDGTYNEKVSVNVSGTPDNYITFKNYNNEEVIIDGTGLPESNLFEVYAQSYLKFEGLNFMNNYINGGAGVIIEHGSHHIQFITNKISNICFSTNPSDPVNENTNANPFVVLGDDETTSCNNIIVDGNEIFDCRPGFSEALTLDGNVVQFEIINNIIHFY
ncbi:MAG: hypothetical protein HY738_15355 [Bacteroidia bacterium]|nr:hypothetical protein [Bacteroidia bacterium]